MKHLCPDMSGTFTTKAVISLFLLLFFTAPAFSYDQDIHYNFSYWMAKKIGFPQNDALVIALSNQQTDDSGLTEPMGLNPTHWVKNNTKRRYWHFPGQLTETKLFKIQTYHDTAENNVYGRYNIVRAAGFDSAGDPRINPYFFGMSLHSYMDTFSHASFGGRKGHVRVGHKPDWPKENKEKTQRMANHVFTHFINYMRAAGLGDEQTIKKATAGKAVIINQAMNVIDSYPSGDNKYLGNDKEINQRIAKWKNSSPSFTFAQAKKSYLWDVSTWKEKAYKHYTLPWTVSDSAVKGMMAGPNAALLALDNTAAGSDDTQYAEDFSVDYCTAAYAADTELEEILFDLFTAKTSLLTAPDAYPETYADQTDCAMNLAATKKGLEVLMAFLDNQETGYTDEMRVFLAMTLFNAVSWQESDLASVLPPYLISANDDTRLFTAWAAHMLKLAGTEAQVQSVFADTLAEQLQNPCAEGDCGEDFRLIDILPLSADFIDLWEKFFTQGTVENVEEAAEALYAIAIDESNTAAAPGSLQQLNTASSGAVNQPVRFSAANLLKTGSPANPQGWDAIDYWTVRAYEDLDDTVFNSQRDKENMAGLTAIILAAVQENNAEKLGAAAIAASSFTPEDLVKDDLVNALVSGLAVGDKETQKMVGLALESITGHSYDLSDVGLQTIAQQVQTSLTKEPLPARPVHITLKTDAEIALAPAKISLDANGGITLDYAVPEYTAPVDVYLGFYSPAGNFYCVDGTATLSPQFVPLKSGTMGGMSGTVDTAQFQLGKGLWQVYWLIVPQGSDGTMYTLGHYTTTVN